MSDQHSRRTFLASGAFFTGGLIAGMGTPTLAQRRAKKPQTIDPVLRFLNEDAQRTYKNFKRRGASGEHLRNVARVYRGLVMHAPSINLDEIARKSLAAELDKGGFYTRDFRAEAGAMLKAETGEDVKASSVPDPDAAKRFAADVMTNGLTALLLQTAEALERDAEQVDARRRLDGGAILLIQGVSCAEFRQTVSIAEAIATSVCALGSLLPFYGPVTCATLTLSWAIAYGTLIYMCP
jgi:hypothetical protein